MTLGCRQGFLRSYTKNLNHIMVNMLDLIKIKNCSLKETIKSKGKPQNGRKIFTTHISNN